MSIKMMIIKLKNILNNALAINHIMIYYLKNVKNHVLILSTKKTIKSFVLHFVIILRCKMEQNYLMVKKIQIRVLNNVDIIGFIQI